MNKQLYIAGLLSVTVFLFSPLVFAQADEPAPPAAEDIEETTADEPEVPASQEVDINEDNYRQFMELKDANRQRNIIPENMFKPDSGLQKLEKLPEESQKHLRNQLREIIVQGDEWQPGDEESEYPYVPSTAASTDPSLEKQEMEAWGELVDSYHQREAQIYENSSGTRSAMGTENGTSSKPGEGAGSPSGTGQSGEGSEAQQAGEEGNADQGADTGSYSPNAARDPNSTSTAGVSQNAMEFLKGLGNGGNASAGEANQGDSREGDGPGGVSPTPTDALSQAQGQADQQGGSEQSSTADNGTQSSARDPNAKSTAGASQNAMEFLKNNSGQAGDTGEGGTGSSEGNEGQSDSQTGEQGEQGDAQADGQQPGQANGQQDGQGDTQDAGQADSQGDQQADGQGEDQGQDGQQTESEQKSATSVPADTTSPVSPAEPTEESTAGASQNALEYLTGEGFQSGDDANNEPIPNETEGTLTIQDLLNAQGVGDSTGSDPASTSQVEEQQPNETKPDKDADG